MLMFYQIFHVIVLYCTIKSNISFLLLNLNKSLEQRTGFSMFIFATGARLKQLVYVWIWPSDWLGYLFPATDLELNRFWPSPF